MDGKMHEWNHLIALIVAGIILVSCRSVPSTTPQFLDPTMTTELADNPVSPTQTPTTVPTPANEPVNVVLSDQLTLHKSGYLLSYLVDSQDYEMYRDLMDAEPSVRIVQDVYAFIQDDFDFVFLINHEKKDFEVIGNGITFALRTYPEIGLGSLSSFPDGLPYLKISTPLESETERLMTMIHYAHKDAIRNGPALHEMMHRWGNFILPVPSRYTMHWGFSNIGGQLGGFTDLEELGNGTFHATHQFRQDHCFSPNSPSDAWDNRNSIPYAPFELYMMGLIGIDEVPSEFLVLDNGMFVDESACIVSGVKHIYQTQDLLQPLRQPTLADSQKAFKILTIVVTTTPLTENDWNHYLQQLLWFEHQGDDGDPLLYNFWEATGGRATVEIGNLTQSLKSQ